MLKKTLLVTSTLLLLAPISLLAYANNSKSKSNEDLTKYHRTDCYDMCNLHLYDEPVVTKDTPSCIPELKTEFEIKYGRTSCYDMCSEHINR